MNFREDKTLPNWLGNSFEGGVFWGTIYTVRRAYLRLSLLVHLCFSNISSKNSRCFELCLCSGSDLYLLCGSCRDLDIFLKSHIGT